MKRIHFDSREPSLLLHLFQQFTAGLIIEIAPATYKARLTPCIEEYRELEATLKCFDPTNPMVLLFRFWGYGV